MSATLTFANTAQARIYGSLAGALSYLGSSTDAWDDVTSDEALQRLLVRAGRLLDSMAWESDYETFAARDALDLADGSVGDAAFPFRAAQYELANIGLTDESVFTVFDQGSNIQSMGAGGAQVTFFSPTSSERGTATLLPPIVMKLIGEYLAMPSLSVGGGRGVSGSDCNPFSSYANGRKEPW